MLHFSDASEPAQSSRTQLLDEIWGDHVFVEERTPRRLLRCGGR
jgi:hypothetical protein